MDHPTVPTESPIQVPRWRVTITYRADANRPGLTRLVADQDEAAEYVRTAPYFDEIEFIDLVLIPRRQAEQAA
ncbi:hypothetical protein GJ654_18645 [Rhodoblastus acidophilus]|uniref:Uncharacterized protein n=1 Tax=Rhodoblastus acidophilus TaxID=1074 RepID=A0A6N8DQW1_RHOAC|nr:hypothetical protein [Rhodoblastus acidophilus]MCW2276347.1 hypothetical protein [Rhodoblastus acidophilus]MTV33002.1 hypothetical protein [Rhodoblastus acidophilus]